MEEIVPASLSDAESIASIYNHYVHHSIATFEEQPVSAEEMVARMNKVVAQNLPWLILKEDGELSGFAYATGWRERSAYRFSVELTIYLAANAGGKGMGTRLYQALFDELVKLNVHCTLAGISLPNEASVKLHEKMGMKKVAHFSEVGFKFGQWIDTGYWERLL